MVPIKNIFKKKEKDKGIENDFVYGNKSVCKRERKTDRAVKWCWGDKWLNKWTEISSGFF